MAAILRATSAALVRSADWMWNYCDPRTCHLYAVSSPLTVVSIVVVYLYFVLNWGPRMMKNREPFNLRKVMLVYNAVQVVWCAYIVFEGISKVWNPWGYSLICEPLSTTMEPLDFAVAKVVHSYFMLKIVDLLDTVFMVLRKNNRQITFLHVYHHAGMVICMWIGTKGFPGGHHTLVGLINSIVHCVLYGYYFLSLYDARIKVAWWKKYITIVQIVQFGINMIHEALPLVTPSCNVNNFASAALLIQNVFMFTLFSDFYIKNYTAKSVKQDKVQKDM